MLQELPIEQKENCKNVMRLYDPTDYSLENFIFDTNKQLQPKSDFVRTLLPKLNDLPRRNDSSRRNDPNSSADCLSIPIFHHISQNTVNTSQMIFNHEGLKQIKLEVWSSPDPSALYRDLIKLQHYSVIAGKSLRDLETRLERQEISAETGEPDTERSSSTLSLPFLLQLNITRFGTVTLVAIAIGILVPLYRFSARLAAFYQSRADILIMHQITGYKRTGIEQLSSIFTPTFDFGKSQAMPDHLTELIRAALSHGKDAE
jgi:hypothetical protein